MPSRVEFFFDVVSPYSWMAFEVLCRYRELWNLDLRVVPIFLGGIMQGSGNKPPATIPAKAAYITVDLQRSRGFFGLPIQQPKDFSKVMFGTLKVQRILTAVDSVAPHLVEEAARQYWLRIWSRDEEIATLDSARDTLRKAGLDQSQVDRVLSISTDKVIKEQLKVNTKKALDLGAFGAPWIAVYANGQQKPDVFFGSDRFGHIAQLLGTDYVGPQLRSKL